MAEIANTSWYRTGSVSTTAGSAIITGTNTIWTAAGINPGATFRIDNDMTPYEVLAVNSDTEIELRTPYKGTTASGRAYSIDRNHQSTPLANLAADVASVMHKYESYIDANMQTVTGMSAYQLAMKNGYTGTEAEWLNSLIGAGQWAELDERTELLENPTWVTKNVLFSGKCLGSAPTEEQLAHIADNSFEGLGLGDYWKDSQGTNWRIHGFNYYKVSFIDSNASGAIDPATGEKRPANWYGKKEIMPAIADYTPGRWMPPHVIVMPDSPLVKDYYVHPEAEDQLAGYFQSYWYTDVRPAILERIINLFGDDHVLEWADRFAASYAPWGSSYLTTVTNAWGRCEIPKYAQIYGQEWFAWYATGGVVKQNNQGWAKTIGYAFPLEVINPATAFVGYSSADFALRECYVGNNGKLYMTRKDYGPDYISHPNETTSKRAFQPYFCLG